MDFSNQGASLYHDIASIYARHADGQLLWITGPRSQELEASWNQMKHIFTTELVNENARVRCDPFSGLDLQELQRPNDTFFVGAFTVPRSGDQSPEERDLRYQFVRQILSQARLDVLRLQAVPQATRARSDARAITELFSSRLRNMVERDEWDATGRSYFEAQAHAFTCRGAPVEFALPAFPCKSSNGEKVSGVLPDKGEELALRELDEFAAAVDAIYPPGCKVWIVSDGHVFSDCSKSSTLLDEPKADGSSWRGRRDGGPLQRGIDLHVSGHQAERAGEGSHWISLSCFSLLSRFRHGAL